MPSMRRMDVGGAVVGWSCELDCLFVTYPQKRCSLFCLQNGRKVEYETDIIAIKGGVHYFRNKKYHFSVDTKCHIKKVAQQYNVRNLRSSKAIYEQRRYTGKLFYKGEGVRFPHSVCDSSRNYRAG